MLNLTILSSLIFNHKLYWNYYTLLTFLLSFCGLLLNLKLNYAHLVVIFYVLHLNKNIVKIALFSNFSLSMNLQLNYELFLKKLFILIFDNFNYPYNFPILFPIFFFHSKSFSFYFSSLLWTLRLHLVR